MLTFWVIAIAMTAAVTLVLVRAAMSAHRQGEDAHGKDIEIYKAQLAEVDRDLERGVIGETEAEALRTEISRRLLAADAAQTSEAADRRASPPVVTLAVTFATAALGVGTYLWIGALGYGDMPLQARLDTLDARAAERPSQEVAQRAFLATFSRPEVGERHQELVADLRAAMESRPDDLRGLALLARNEASLGNYNAAIATQRQIIDVKAENVISDDFLSLAELMIVAAGGYVSPEAEENLRRAYALEPTNGAALYYIGLMYEQSGRVDRTFAIWAPLLEQSGPSDDWVPFIREQLPEVAIRAGIRYVLPDQRGPSEDDLLAAQELSEDERAAMIEGMVQGLAQRLSTQGGPPEDWARLITAQAVLGDLDTAGAILQEARVVFADRADAMRLFQQTARQAGLE